jgi:acyl carrier protein
MFGAIMAFSREDTQAKIVDIIVDKLSIPRETIKPEATFKDIGADSLDIVEIIMSFEEIFGIEIKDEDAEKITNIKEAIDLIHEARTK